MVDRVEVLRIFAREAQQAARLVDEQQVFILEQDLDGGTARGGDKGIDDGGHGRLRAGNGGAIILQAAARGESGRTGQCLPGGSGGK
ncbi:hypothetical protein D3C75_1129390 [compost metagenome]